MHLSRRPTWWAVATVGAALVATVLIAVPDGAGEAAAEPGPAVAQPARPPAPAGTAARATKAAKKPARDRAIAEARTAIRRSGATVHSVKDERYAARSTVVDPDGAHHVRFDRTFRGLGVLGGDFVVHTNPDGSLRGTTVAQGEPITVGTEPAVSRQRAASVAAGRFTGVHQRSAATLVVDAAAGKPVLAWRVVVDGTTTKGAPSRLVVVLDATSGVVRRSFAGIHTADAGTGHGLHVGEVPLSTTRRGDGSYELVHPDRPGFETRDGRNEPHATPERSTAFVDADNAWGDGTMADRATAAVDVHHGLQQAWDYFRQAHGRNGIRDDGKGATALVHEAVDMANASWSDVCFCMTFGDGDATVKPFTSLDIVAHEMTHGVTSATARLEYSGESGGLNEATSDIFGTLVEFAAGNARDQPDYLVGELLDNGGVNRPLRHMDDPTKDGLSHGCWSSALGSADVHHSSGVGNKFFYNLAVGSGPSSWGDSPTCASAPPVTGIGNDSAGQIWYRALTAYMVSNTNYAGARRATLLAATDLFGTGSTEYATVDAAWRAVGVDGSQPLPEAPALPNPGQQYGTVGDSVSLQITAVDGQGDPITYSAEDLPPGLSISESGLISGTLTKEGWRFVLLSAADPAGHTTTVYFFWDVYGPPVVRNPGDQRSAVGAWAYLQIEATDESTSLSYAFTGLPEGVEHHGSGLLAGIPARAGVYPVSVTVTDDRQLSTSTSWTWTVTGAGPAATVDAPADPAPAPARTVTAAPPRPSVTPTSD
jgi:Zn-dependent metalloprotease